MSEESQHTPEFLPHLTVLVVLFVLEYWTFMSHVSSLTMVGDYGPLVGIPLLLSLILMIIISLGLYSICENKPVYNKIVSITLILFVVQMALVFIEYVVIALEM
ncbi:MAG: hypothetical protein KGY80_02085 [Candidatus Thorarchaeota archaeon]|nr:hypothetical protein [Candidatus Thorarchaeota archaeon]